MRRAIFSLFGAATLLLALPVPASASTGEGCGSGACTDCHSLSREEARILGSNVDSVLSVDRSPVRGLWEAAVEEDGRRWPLYIDFSKDYVVAGAIGADAILTHLKESRAPTGGKPAEKKGSAAPAETRK